MVYEEQNLVQTRYRKNILARLFEVFKLSQTESLQLSFSKMCNIHIVRGANLLNVKMQPFCHVNCVRISAFFGLNNSEWFLCFFIEKIQCKCNFVTFVTIFNTSKTTCSYILAGCYGIGVLCLVVLRSITNQFLCLRYVLGA
jgi:hypothetical protein